MKMIGGNFVNFEGILVFMDFRYCTCFKLIYGATCNT